MPTRTRIVAVYLRISIDRADQQVGITRQRADCLALARTRWPRHQIVEFVDNDVSAYDTRRARPAYTDMLASHPHAIVAWNLDRLLRQPRDLEQLIDQGIPIITATGDLDLTTHDGQLHARILAAVAKKSSDDTARRVSRAARDRREQGRWHGARRVPFGYQTLGRGILEPHPEHAQVVAEVARDVARGTNLTAAIRGLAVGPTTRDGWRQLLTSQTIRGRMKDGTDASWPAIVDDATADIVAIRLATKQRKAAERWPLSTVLRCGECGASMYGTTTNGHRHYFCRSCFRVSIAAGPTEQVVLAALDHAVLEVRVEQTAKPAVDDARLAELAGMYVRGEITRAEWASARAVVEHEALQPVHPPNHVVGQRRRLEPGDPWSRLVVVEHIVVERARRRGPRFDPDRLGIVWRQ